LNCEQCQTGFEPKRKGQRFCTGLCRSAWHRAKNLPGIVHGLRQLANGAWSLTVHYPALPPLSRGQRCRIETD
jgi:hypothetical protein